MIAPVVLLGFGSSARRGASGWTDRARVRALLDVAQPDVVVDGASPSDRREMVDGVEVLRGADLIVHVEALQHFEARGLPTARAVRCPYDPAIDGPAPRGFFARNVRQYRENRPSIAASWISGRVGSPLSSGSAHMVGVCLRGLDGVPPCPVVVYRDDGLEPLPGGGSKGLPVERWQMWRLAQESGAPEIAHAGRAVKALAEGRTTAAEVLAALGCARETVPRWGPWIEAVERTIRLVL